MMLRCEQARILIQSSIIARERYLLFPGTEIRGARTQNSQKYVTFLFATDSTLTIKEERENSTSVRNRRALKALILFLAAS